MKDQFPQLVYKKQTLAPVQTHLSLHAVSCAHILHGLSSQALCAVSLYSRVNHFNILFFSHLWFMEGHCYCKD